MLVDDLMPLMEDLGQQQRGRYFLIFLHLQSDDDNTVEITEDGTIIPRFNG